MPMGGMGPMPMPMGGPMGSMPGSAYGTPYPGNALMMNGVGSEYGTPYVEGYPPTIARTHSLRTPSVYEDDRDLYDRDRGYYDRGYERGYDRDYYDSSEYDRGRRYESDPYRRSSSRASRRSYRDYDDDYDYDYRRGRSYDDSYYDSRYRSSSSRYRSSRDYYPSYSSSSGYYSSSGSGRKREDLSVIRKNNGEVKVLRNGQERFGDKFRRMFGIDPKGVNIVRVKRGEQLAAHISR